MINLRYHIVSITAVFLALAIGVLLGGTYLDKYTVDQLDQSITSAEGRIRETRSENDRLRGEIGDAQARNQVLLERGINELFGAQVVDVPVLIVASEGADEISRRNLVRALSSSGADFQGTLTVTGKMKLDDDGLADEAADALNLDTTLPARVRAEVAREFATALADAAVTAQADPLNPTDTTAPVNPAQTTDPSVPTETSAPAVDPETPTETTAPLDPNQPSDSNPPTQEDTPVEPPTQPEIVTTLLDLGLLAYEPPADPALSGPLLSGQGYRYVFLSGEAPEVADTSFLIPTLRAMAASGPIPAVMVAATPSVEDAESPVSRVRADAELSRLISTVDNIESFNGIAATMLALDEMGLGARGHYGEGRGAAAPLPTGT